MAEPQLVFPVSGSEVQTQDLQLLGQTAGLADDRVLAEFMRLTPFDGARYAKAIAPYGLREANASNLGTVISPGINQGIVAVLPFRAFVGSRVVPLTNPLANWRDIRSGVFVGPTNGPVFVQLQANTSGNTRWDLVCAQLTVDNPSNTVLRRAKDSNTSEVSIISFRQTLSATVSIVVANGAPSVSPVPPVTPPDQPFANPAVFYIPLASVRVPNGFSGVSTVAPQDIRDASTPVLISSAMGAVTACPATGNNDRAGTYATNFPWSTTVGTRPAMWLPPGMTGGEWRIIEIDALTGSPSHPDGSVVDDSTDWRNRFFISFTQVAQTGFPFGNDPASAPGIHVPYSASGVSPSILSPAITQLSNSCQSDAFFGASTSAVVTMNNVTSGGVVPGGSSVGVYVDLSDGKMKCRINGSPAIRMWSAVMAFGVLPNK